jgi:hypothetical protein
VYVLLRLFKIFILLLEIINPFDSHLLFFFSLSFTLLYGNVIFKKYNKISRHFGGEGGCSPHPGTPLLEGKWGMTPIGNNAHVNHAHGF